MPGLVALRATSPSIVEVLLDYTRAGPKGPSPRFVRPVAKGHWPYSQRTLGQRPSVLEHGLVAQRATSPCRACGHWPKASSHMPSIEYGMGQASLGPCLIGTTFMISLRNCCYAAIRYEIMKVVPLFQAATGLQSSGHGPLAHEGNENHHFDLIYLVATAEGQVTLTKSNLVKRAL